MKSFLASSNLEFKMPGSASFDFPPKVLYENRYCNQDNFSVLVCGGLRKNNKTVESIF